MSEADSTEDSIAFNEGRIRLRFIRAKKKPPGSMSNRKDGQIYWMFPRHAALPYWELVDKIDYPFVPRPTEAQSAIIGSLDDMEKPAYLGESGMKIGPGGLTGGFVEPLVKEVVPEDFPYPTPTAEWRKQKLLDFITSKGGVAFMSMTRDQLLAVALNLT